MSKWQEKRSGSFFDSSDPKGWYIVNALKVTNVAAVAVIYPRSDPREIFTTKKDGTYPFFCFRGTLCPPGGSWNKKGIGDWGPLATVARELREEFALSREPRSGGEFSETHGVAGGDVYDPTELLRSPTDLDRRLLWEIVEEACQMLVPFWSYANTVPQSVIAEADPGTLISGFTTLVYYFTAELGRVTWTNVQSLQEKFGNLSNESISMVTDLSALMKGSLFGLGHAQAMRAFFLGHHVQAVELPLFPGVTSTDLGPFSGALTYEEILQWFDVQKNPRG